MQDLLKSFMLYNPNSGNFVATKALHGRPIGTIIGSSVSGRYWKIWFNGSYYLAHRLAWLYMTGEFPEQDLDHINGNGFDNRWTNLRIATKSQNQNNAYRKIPGQYGRGVRKVGKRFAAQININGSKIYLGSFDTTSEAEQEYFKYKNSILN